MLLERVWDFSALGGLTSSVSSGRVIKLTVFHYYSAPLPLQKRGYGGRNPKPCRVHDSKHWEWVGRWPVGVACTMAVIFGTRKER